MKVLDLFAGLKGWSQPFADRGHETFTVELYPRFDPDLQMDILDVTPDDLPWVPDLVLASPPCTAFTTMTMGRNWTHGGAPKTPTAELGRDLVLRTRWLIDQLQPRWFIIENPMGRLRTLPYLDDLVRLQLPGAPERSASVWYCRYGEERAKPTDLWGVPPPSFRTRPICHNGNPDHAAAPRGSYSGTQGMRSDVAAKIPYQLALDVCLAAEVDLAREAVA